MRTTLDIDEDVLLAVKEKARREKRTAGAVLSEVARRGLNRQGSEVTEPESFYGFEPLPPRGEVVSNEWIDRILDEEPE